MNRTPRGPARRTRSARRAPPRTRRPAAAATHWLPIAALGLTIAAAALIGRVALLLRG